MNIRQERPTDSGEVRRVLEMAFGGSQEAQLVELLRRDGAVSLSLVALKDHDVVGHILFSPVRIESDRRTLPAVALGPMAVLPAQQRRGIGSALVRTGLARCRELGHHVVVVLGHPSYYPRFGFAAANTYGVACEFDVPAEAFMITELAAGALSGQDGIVKYHPAFGSV